MDKPGFSEIRNRKDSQHPRADGLTIRSRGVVCVASSWSSRTPMRGEGRHPMAIHRVRVDGCKGAWAAGPISGWERPQWCGKATWPGPRGGDADAPRAGIWHFPGCRGGRISRGVAPLGCGRRNERGGDMPPAD